MYFFEDEAEFFLAYNAEIDKVKRQTGATFQTVDKQIEEFLLDIKELRKTCVELEEDIFNLDVIEKEQNEDWSKYLMRSNNDGCEKYGFGISSGSIYCVKTSKVANGKQGHQFCILSVSNKIDAGEIELHKVLGEALQVLITNGYKIEAVVCSLQCGYCYNSNFSEIERIMRPFSISDDNYQGIFDISDVKTHSFNGSGSYFMLEYLEDMMRRKDKTKRNLILKNFEGKCLIERCENIIKNIFKTVSVLFGSWFGYRRFDMPINTQATVRWEQGSIRKVLRIFRLKTNATFQREESEFSPNIPKVFVSKLSDVQILTRDNFINPRFKIPPKPEKTDDIKTDGIHSQIISRMLLKKLKSSEEVGKKWWERKNKHLSSELQKAKEASQTRIESWQTSKSNNFTEVDPLTGPKNVPPQSLVDDPQDDPQQTSKKANPKDRGYVYCATNEFLEEDSVFKIGLSQYLPARMNQLTGGTTSTAGFKAIFWIYINDMSAIEKLLFNALDDFRLPAKRGKNNNSRPEFFQVPRETVRILFEHTATTGNGIFCQKEFIHSAQRAKCFAQSTHLPTVQEFETETIDYYPTLLSTRVKEAFRKET